MCRDPKVVCCVQVISSSGAPTIANTKGFCVAVCVCVFVCVKKKLILQESMLCEFKNTEFDTWALQQQNKNKKTLSGICTINRRKSSFNMRHPN